MRLKNRRTRVAVVEGFSAEEHAGSTLGPVSAPSRVDRYSIDATRRAFLCSIFLLYVFFGFVYSLLYPMWQITDEISHYAYALHYVDHGTAPPLDLHEQAHQPRAYYWLASFPLRILDHFDPDAVRLRPPSARSLDRDPKLDWRDPSYRFLWGPHLLRWLNLLLGVATLAFVFDGTRNLFPRHEALAVATLALAALTPPFVFRNMLVSNDALANTAGACLFCLMGRLCRPKVDAKLAWISLGCACVFPLFIKLTVLPVALAVMIQVLYSARSATRLAWATGTAAFLSIAIAVIAVVQKLDQDAATSLWKDVSSRVWLSHAAYAEHGTDAILRLARKYWSVAADMEVFSDYAVPVLAGVGASICLTLVLARGYPRIERPLGLVGLPLLVWLGVEANSWEATFAVSLFALLLYGSGRFFRIRGRTPSADFGELRSWFAVWSAVALAFSIVLHNTLGSPWTHGRYFHPEIGAISLVAVGGWFLALPNRRDFVIPSAVILGMFVCNALLTIKLRTAFALPR